MEDPDTIPLPPVDLGFTADINKKMHVPQHIRLTNGFNGPSSQIPDEPVGFIRSRMNVPDRILVTGGDQHVGDSGHPVEIKVDRSAMAPLAEEHIYLETPPRSLRLDQRSFPTVDEEFAVRRRQQNTDKYDVDDAEELLRVDSLGNSSAPSLLSAEDEVRILKRHMTRLATRVYAIEQDQQYRSNRDFYMYLLMAAYVSFKVIHWVRSL